ncbi:MAG: tRNA sulfurtransferase, partial [Methanohalobium sp.]|uniref:tRNA sulfurtransferase n=1 Tax=Methanohalobium sp. TaxID=2837493 RepID=UPI00397850AA
RATRTGNHDFSSHDIGVICGDAVYSILGSAGKNPSVDLTNPDREIFVEMRQKYAYIHTSIVKGVGGLPLGSQGKMVALISGGIDSPVAAWRMMKRGVTIIPVYFNNEPHNTKMRKRAMDCIKVLQKWAAGHSFKVYEVPHHKDLLTFTDYCTTKKTCLLCRRSMYIEAHEIMKKEGAKGIITGAALGQVASQTVANMYAEMYGLAIPLYHPLISFDKEEVIDIARNIGTFEISTRSVGECFALPDRPEVRADYNSLISEEEKIDINALVKEAIKNAKIVEL